MHSNTIYKDHAIDGNEDQYLVYVLYRDGNIPHYVGATLNSSRPYSNKHKARQGHNVTSVEIVQESMTLEDAGKLEDQLINEYGKTEDGGTLVNQRGGGHGLKTYTDEAKANISAALKGRKLSDETKAKMSLARKGRKGHAHTEETKGKIGQAQRGRVITEEHKAKLAEARRGKTHTDETKAKMRAAWAKRRAVK